MSRSTHHSNLAARMGRWSAAHWKTATFGWLAFVRRRLRPRRPGRARRTPIRTRPGPGESGRMDRILDAGFKQPAGESVLDPEPLAPRERSRLQTPRSQDVVARVSKRRRPERPLAVRSRQRGQIAKNGHAALVEFEIRGDKDKAADKIGPVLDERRRRAARSSRRSSSASSATRARSKAVETAYGNDLAKAGLLSLPITLLILVLTFGALVAAGIPLLLALTAVFATFGLIALPSHLLPMAQQAPAMVLLIGLAVGVDYSMFYLKREREERAAGRSERAALEAAAATSGRSVLDLRA